MHALGLFLDARLGSDVSQAEALVIMHLAGGPRTINDVHRAFLHRRSTLTSVIDRLEAKTLIRRGSAPDDRRTVRLELTARGERVARSIAEALEALRIDVASDVTIDERDIKRVRAIAESASARASDGT